MRPGDVSSGVPTPPASALIIACHCTPRNRMCTIGKNKPDRQRDGGRCRLLVGPQHGGLLGQRLVAHRHPADCAPWPHDAIARRLRERRSRRLLPAVGYPASITAQREGASATVPPRTSLHEEPLARKGLDTNEAPARMRCRGLAWPSSADPPIAPASWSAGAIGDPRSVRPTTGPGHPVKIPVSRSLDVP